MEIIHLVTVAVAAIAVIIIFVGAAYQHESSLALDRPPLCFGHPRHAGAGSAVTAAKTKKGHPTGRPFLVFGGGGGS